MTMDTYPTSTSCAGFLEEHRELAEALQVFERLLDGQNRARGVVERQLQKLADLVESHFAHEEEGGYMADAVTRAPRLSTTAEKLVGEHTELLDDVKKLHLLARSGVETEAWWRQIDKDFTRLKARLLAHEHAENNLMHEAFNRDIGIAD